MDDQSESVYGDGEVVWVKLGGYWWPGEVVALEKLPPDVLPSFRKPPIAVVKFFQEDTYEYVKNHNFINKYNCSQKSEYIKKGLDTYRTKHGRNMEKFPEDVIRAETATGGDVNILTRDEFQETKKESYAGLFGTPVKKSPFLAKKGKGRRSESICKFSNPIRKTAHEKSDYKVHILVQSSKSTPTQSDETTVPSTSQSRSESVEKIAAEEKDEDKTENAENSEKSHMQISTPTMSKGIYSCHACPFTTTRLNVMILHNKTHSVTFIPYTPSPVRKKVEKPSLKQVSKTKIPKERNSRKEKPEKRSKQSIKRSLDESPGATTVDVKKVKTDVEIKSSLLADWDDCEEDSIDESLSMLKSGSPDVPVPLGSESPARPIPNELPDANIPADADADVPIASASAAAGDEKNEEKDNHTEEKLGIPSDSKYEFCEDEDWPLEADVGRKIPRVKNASKRKEDTKSLSLDENDVAKEVAELLSKTTVPELPSVPDTLKIEENFPELPIVKTPDKKPETPKVDQVLPDKPENQSPKPTIFKTKTFFRSRHSRSQDAIGKYVAEQLNAAERMDMSENDLNGLEIVSSPEARESPPVEHIKIARLAPKIQLKKMKAEALQMQEKEKNCSDPLVNIVSSQLPNTVNAISIDNDVSKEKIQESQCRLMLNQIEADNKGINQSELNSKNLHEVSNVNEEVLDNSDKEKIEKTVTGSPTPVLTFSDTSLQKSYAQAIETLMNESTASAVDALLSVSLEKDRVTKVISDDPPEDLFEDDNKDNETVSNGFGQNVVKEHQSEHLPTNDLENKNKVLENVLIENKYEMLHKHESKNSDLTLRNTSLLEEIIDVTKPNDDKNQHKLCFLEKDKTAINIPSESDLQIAETLINLPATAIQSNLATSDNLDTQTNLEKKQDIPSCQDITDVISETVDVVSEKVKLKPVCSETVEIQKITELDKSLSNENLNLRFETEQEKSENLNAAQSLVQMSESINHSIGIFNSKTKTDKDENTVEKKDTDQVPVEKTHVTISNVTKPNDKFESSSPKLLKILEEPCVSKMSATKPPLSKQLVITGKEKILNFDVGGTSPKGKGSTPKQKIIIRRTTGGSTLINKLGAVTSTEKIILSRDNKTQDSSSIQTYTIKTSPDLSTDSNKIVIQPKIRKIAKPSPKLQKLKSQTITEKRLINEITSDDPIFDINSMPIVLSDDILTPENIEKMPIVMSDGNIITNQSKTQKIKNKSTTEEKLAVNISNKPEVKSVHKQEIKTFRMNPVSEANKATTPNILSKSSKLRGAKPMLVIDKTTGKQKIIMTKSETSTKEISQIQSKIQPASQNINKSEKFIILPTASSPRPTQRTQKIVIDPQTGKAHVVLTKGPDSPINVSETKSVPAKLLPSVTDSANTGNTVMIITNSQGAQSRIVLTPEHEKILFPNKQQPNVSQLKPITQRVNTNSILPKASVPTVTSTKTHTKIVPKQKSAIITSKGQLIVGGRVATTAQNIAPMPEIRPVPKRMIASEPKKLVQTIQKTSSEPIIFLQQKSGSVMQLTAAQFEHLQRTGQIIQTSAPVQEGKIILQKSITIPGNEPVIPNAQKSKIKRQASNSPTPVKKIKHEITIAPAPVTLPTPTPMPALTSLSNSVTTTFVPSVSNTVSVTTSAYPELDNFEELLPSTAIVRQTESSVITPEPTPAPPPASLSDGQLIAVPGEHFGGPAGSFYLCIEDNGTLTPIDNRPLVLENNQLVPMTIEPSPMLTPQPERRDILEAALANSDVFHADSPRDEAPDFRDLNANVSVHCRVSETSTTLNQPIMTPVEVPSKVDSEPAIPSTLEDGLAVIGVTPHTVPTSLELPITVTDPRIAPKTTDPLSSNNYGPTLLTSPNTEMTFVATEETDLSVGPISMPLLTEEDSVGKSMPLLTDEVITERTVSSVESTIGSPSSIDVRESETEDGSGGQWARRLLTPGSDTSETSAEIPLQPSIQLSINEMSRNS